MINYTSQRITKVLGLIAMAGLGTLMNAQTYDWKPAGPVYNAGRARNMVVEKNNSQVLYVGSASSGIFKSLDGGSNWAPINDQATVRNISYLAQAADGKIYAGTGEGFLRPGQKVKAQQGTGLYVLNENNSPATLDLVAPSSLVGTIINRVACSPTGNNIALATNLGIFTSVNGAPFTMASLPTPPTGANVAGQDVKFDANGILYCSIGTESGASNANTASKVYKTTDASLSTFIAITPTSSVLPDNFHGRIELAIAPSNPNVIYAACANKYVSANTATMKGLFVSYNGGTNWALISQGSSQLDPMSNGGTLASGDYASVITVNPTNPDQLFFGSYSFYVWTRNNNSTTNPIGDWVSLGISYFQNIQYYLHQNIHDIKFIHNSATPAFYFVTDAGIFKSTDLPGLLGNLAYHYNLGQLPSFQPFYKGLITGQFNSVSIERYPIGEGVGATAPGSKVTPYSGFIGGTGGNGLTYFSGTFSLVTTELNYIGGEVYNTEYSKILPNAALASSGSGNLYRSSNVKNSPPTVVNTNKYSNPLSRIAPTPAAFSNPSYNTVGTYFKLWENYGNVAIAPDSAVFYNDTVRYQASMTGLATLTTQTTFTFSTSRPNRYALIDSVVIRTATVSLPISGTYSNVPTAYLASERMTVYVPLPKTYSLNSGTVATTMTNSAIGPVNGPVSFTFNPATLIDNISLTFQVAPFATKTVQSYSQGGNVVVSDPASYYRVLATVFYKYAAGDPVTVIDNNISTRTTSYTAVLTNSLSWRYGSGLPSYTYSAFTNTINSTIPNPTFVVNPGGTTTTNTLITLAPPPGSTNYTLSTYGTYTLTADPVTYTIAANINTNVTAPYVYSISPGNYTQATNIFTVTPTGLTDYTMTQSGSNTLTEVTYSTLNTSYVLTYTTAGTPVNTVVTTQASSVFIVTPTVSTTYTIAGVSSNTNAGVSTVKTATTLATNFAFTIGNATLPMAPNNKPFKMPMHLSARLAILLNNADNTLGSDAVVVSKNPLALNDPLNLIRVSQTGAYSDDASGNPTTQTVTIDGKPTLLEWSKSGTEIYFATSSNKLYRVSHITTLMDLSPSSYSGKFYSDIFLYNNGITTTPNPASPYRTTLIGSFDRTITSISVSNDNKNVAVTFNTTGTGTTGIVMYNTVDARTANTGNIGWTNKQGTLPSTVNVTYSSLMEKTDSKIFFLGTDNGMYVTSDVSAPSPVWANVNANATSKLPNVQVFDIRQQTMAPWDCYNSGQIYVATNGRGVWTNGTYQLPFIVGVNEYQKPLVEGKNMNLFPNPTNGIVNVNFNGEEGETATIQIMDLSGRVVQSEELGKLTGGEVSREFDTQALNSGVYIVNISSNSGIKRVTKLVVTK